jgi:hypothetical protein
MDLQILRFGIYKLACKFEKSIKEKHKFKTLSSYWAGSPTRGPRSRTRRTHQRGPKQRRSPLTRVARGLQPPASAAADRTGPQGRERKGRGGTAMAEARRLWRFRRGRRHHHSQHPKPHRWTKGHEGRSC